MSNKVGFISGLAVGSFDADDSFATIDLVDGNGANVSHAGHARLRFNLSTQQLEQSINTGAWVGIATGTSAGSSLAKYIIQTADASLPNAQTLSTLGTGLVKNTTGTGVLSIAIANTDFPAVSAQYIVATGTAAPPNAQNLGILTSGILQQTVTAGVATLSIKNSTALSVLGRATNSTGVPDDIQATASGFFLRRDGNNTLGFGAITTADISGILASIRIPKPNEYWVYLLDYDGTGNDITGAPGIGSSVAFALSQAIPIKTFERLDQILPRIGNGATLVVLIKPRASGAPYRNIANTADADSVWMNNLTDWYIVVRGSLDFANNTNDKIRAGFLTLSGTNTGGYNTIAGSTTNSLVCQLAGGGAAGLPVETSGQSTITGYRIRFLANTTTTALQNFCTGIWQNTSTTIIPMINLPATPSASDVFVIEGPGVTVGSLSFTAGWNRAFSLVGFNCTGTAAIVAPTPQQRIAGCVIASTFSLSFGEQHIATTSYMDETATSITVGFGFRAAGSANLNTSKTLSVSASSWFGSTALLINAGRIQKNLGSACVCINGIRDLTTSGPELQTVGNQDITGTSINRKLRIDSPSQYALRFGGAGVDVFGVDISNCTNGGSTAGCIWLSDTGGSTVKSMSGTYLFNDIVSSAGGNAFGTVSLTNAVLFINDLKYRDGLKVYWGSLKIGSNTITADRDILFDGGISARFSDLAIQNLQVGDIHIYGGDAAVGDYFNILNVNTPTTLIETHNLGFFHDGPFPPYRVYNFIGYADGPGTAPLSLPAQADVLTNCNAIAGVATNYAYNAGDLVTVAQAGPVKIEFVNNSFPSGIFPTGAIAYLSELGGTDTGKARIGPSVSGVAIPLGPIQAVSNATGTFAVVNLNSHGKIYVPTDGHISTSVVGNPFPTFSGVLDIQATASGQFLKRDGNNTLGFGPILLSDLPNTSSVSASRQIIAGSGIAGGGDLSADRTFNIGTVDSTIIVNADTIQVGTITTTNITNDAVDNTKIRNSIGTSVIGRSANSTGDPADIQAIASGQFLRRDGNNTLGFGAITTEDLPGSVTSVSGINIIAGAGLTGGGNLTTNRTIDVVAADTTITVNADSIKVNIITSGNISDNQVNNSILRDSAANSVIGRSANTIGDPADIIATASGQFLKRDGNNTVLFGPILLSDLPISIPGGTGVPTNRQIIAGSGLAGGGDLSIDRTINVGAADGTIIVNADTIQVGVITTANITNNAVDNTKIRDSIATSVIGRSVNSTGDPADIQATASGQFLRRDATSLGFAPIGLTDLPGSVTSVSGVVLTAGAGLTGGGALTTNRTFDVVAADATITVNPDSIQVGVIQNANIRNAAATTVIGRSANSIGQVADITALASGHFLRRDGSGVLGFGTIVLSDLPPGITGGGGGGGDVFSTRQVIAGAGLTGGGNLTADRTFDVVAADGTITVAADNIKVGIITNANVNDNSITVVKLSSGGGPILLGRDNGSAGSIKELDIVAPLHLEPGDTELTIRPNGLSILGRSDTSSTSNVENITATTSGQFLGFNGSTLAFRPLASSDLSNSPTDAFSLHFSFGIGDASTGNAATESNLPNGTFFTSPFWLLQTTKFSDIPHPHPYGGNPTYIDANISNPETLNEFPVIGTFTRARLDLNCTVFNISAAVSFSPFFTLTMSKNGKCDSSPISISKSSVGANTTGSFVSLGAFSVTTGDLVGLRFTSSSVNNNDTVKFTATITFLP